MDWIFAWRTQFAVGIFLTIGPLIAWPISAVTVFRGEPQGILALSYLALVFAGYSTMAVAIDMRKTEESSNV